MRFSPFVSVAALSVAAATTTSAADNVVSSRQLLQQQYIGCFRDNPQHRVMEYFHQSSGSMTVGDCAHACRELGHPFAGLEYGSECYCGNEEYASRGTARNCNMMCGGVECGGSFALSVFGTNPTQYANEYTPSPTTTPPDTFRGCWRDAEDRVMEYQHDFDGFLTVEMCVQACTEYGAKFAGLEVGRQCFCGNDYQKYGLSDSCNRKCNGFGCGGDWSLSVYETFNNEQVRHARDNPRRNHCIATGWGDPHIVTFDGLLYDVHVLSEVIMLKSRNTDFEIQARMEAVPGHNGDPAVTTGVVVKEADFSLPTIQVSLAQSGDSEHAVAFLGSDCHVQLFVNGVARDITTGTGRDDAHVTVLQNRLLKVEYPTTSLVLDMEVRIWSSACHFSIDYILMDCRPEDDSLVGILGSPDGNRANDWMNEHGDPVEIPSGVNEHFFEPAYDYVHENWCIEREEDSHFTYESGTEFSDFENCGKQ